jgi:hypothetical protein
LKKPEVFMENNQNENQSEANQSLGQTNQERDHDHGDMNNGEIGGSMGIRSSSNDQDEAEYSKTPHEGGPSTVKGDTGGGADNGSKTGSALGLDGGAENAGGQQEGSIAENI